MLKKERGKKRKNIRTKRHERKKCMPKIMNRKRKRKK
jgi:hypothetical protein